MTNNLKRCLTSPPNCSRISPCANQDHGRPSASYSERLLGYGCGASGVSITRRLLALSLSSVGGLTLPATNYGAGLAAPTAATKVQHFSIQAGPVIK
jgi:hypothetical protein